MKEGFYFSTEEDENHPKVINKVPFYGPNLFPKQVPELKENVLEWLDRMEKLGTLLLEVIAESLGFERDFFKK